MIYMCLNEQAYATRYQMLKGKHFSRSRWVRQRGFCCALPRVVSRAARSCSSRLVHGSIPRCTIPNTISSDKKRHTSQFVTHNAGQLEVDDRILESLLPRYTQLRYLDLRNCRHITDRSLSWIAVQCPNLKRLELRGCVNVTDVGKSAFRDTDRSHVIDF